MNIVVVNDDGYDAIGIQILAKHLLKYGDIVVYAPATGQSAQSQARLECWITTLRESFKYINDMFGLNLEVEYAQTEQKDDSLGSNKQLQQREQNG